MSNKNRTPQIVTIERLSHEGRGIALVDGKTTFIEGALPGETVEILLQKKRSKANEGLVENVLEPSALRQSPKCDYFLTCGGCSLQHMSSEQQISLKEATLLEQLRHFGEVEPKEILPPLMGPAWGYRHKARLAVKSVTKKGDVLVGFREKNGRYVADMTHCEVLHPKVGQSIQKLRVLFSQFEHKNEIPQVEVAIAEAGETVVFVIRHLSPLSDNERDLLIQYAKDEGVAIYCQPKGLDSVYPLYPEHPTTLSYTLPEFKLAFDFKPLDFTQVNVELNQKMVSLAMELLAPNNEDHVLDLFCGLGNFSLPIAQLAKSVVGVEGDTDMVQRARHNADKNQIKNVDFYCANLFESISEVDWAGRHFDKALIDPPRSGALEVVGFLAERAVKRLVYVSCNPATLARDAGVLINQYDYVLTKAGVMDMFPQTKHVESIAVFEKEH